MAEANRKGAIRSALRHRDFRLLIAGQAISNTGDWLYSVALIVYVLERTNSAGWVGLTSVIRFLPYVLFGTFGGVIADKYDRKKVMIIADLARGIVMLGLSLVAAAEGSPLAAVALAALSTTFSSAYLPCVHASTPALVGEEDLAAANTIIATIANVTLVVGPAVGGLLLILGSPATAFAVNAVTFFASAGLTLPIRTKLSVVTQEEGEGPAPFSRRLSEGFRAIASSSTVVLIVVLLLGFTLFYGQEIVLYSLVGPARLGLGDSGIAFMFAATGVGGILSAGFVSRVNASSKQGGLLVLAAVVSALPMMALAIVHSPAVAYSLLLIEGVGVIIGDVLSTTMLQRILPRDVLGRVMGIMDSVMVAGILAGSLIAPVVVRVAGLETALVAAGGLLVALGLVALPKARELDRASAAAAAELQPKVELLEKLGIFEAASRQTLEALAGAVTEVDVSAGAVVIREGDEPDDLYVVEYGTLSVASRGEASRQRQVAELSAGDYFGEIGLLQKVPRTATVLATSDSRLYRISGEDFIRIVAEGLRVSGNLRAGMAARLARTHPSVKVASDA